MGVKQSKRSVDITETSTKGEIEGFGNEGKVEKILDGVAEKVAANGHVDGDLQNGIEPVQNGVELIQNGEAAAVATEKVSESKEVDESLVEGVANGQLENVVEANGEAEKPEEDKKSQEKKDKKKEKKESLVKKFSFKNFSFSKKDKSKPLKKEKSAAKVEETETKEEQANQGNETDTSLQNKLVDTTMPESHINPVNSGTTSSETFTISEPVSEKNANLSSQVGDDLPPPLPASPPPSEPVEGKVMSDVNKLEVSESANANPTGEVNEIGSSMTVNITEESKDVIKNAEQIAMETGKQIEEKATNLLKAVEERAEESMRGIEEPSIQKAAADVTNEYPNAGVEFKMSEAKEEIQGMEEGAKKLEEEITAVPVEISNAGVLSPKGEDLSDKLEEGAGESLADIPKDLTDEVTAATVEINNPDSLEISATIPPPPVVEAVTGE